MVDVTPWMPWIKVIKWNDYSAYIIMNNQENCRNISITIWRRQVSVCGEDEDKNMQTWTKRLRQPLPTNHISFKETVASVRPSISSFLQVEQRKGDKGSSERTWKMYGSSWPQTRCQRLYLLPAGQSLSARRPARLCLSANSELLD